MITKNLFVHNLSLAPNITFSIWYYIEMNFLLILLHFYDGVFRFMFRKRHPWSQNLYFCWQFPLLLHKCISYLPLPTHHLGSFSQMNLMQPLQLVSRSKNLHVLNLLLEFSLVDKDFFTKGTPQPHWSILDFPAEEDEGMIIDVQLRN